MKKPVYRQWGALAVCVALAAPAAPASAQFYYAAPDLATAPVTGAEPELGLNLPGATPAELKAALVWHLRVALNISALQCDFEPSLLTVSNYNATLAHHKSELADSFNMLTGYFKRMNGGSARAGTTGFDQYNTRVYSSYSTVSAQKDFCNTMGKIGREAIFADRGGLSLLAQRRLGEVKRALVATGEQYFTNPAYNFRATLPLFTKKCWKKNELRDNCEEAWKKYAASRAQ
tara:strand:+ start:72460 stop:73155 length:696 start_codon:yes stop_codon:yes gene_type:complete